jgi:hypothetical protein
MVDDAPVAGSLRMMFCTPSRCAAVAMITWLAEIASTGAFADVFHPESDLDGFDASRVGSQPPYRKYSSIKYVTRTSAQPAQTRNRRGRNIGTYYLGQPPAEEIAAPETVQYPARTIDAKTTA